MEHPLSHQHRSLSADMDSEASLLLLGCAQKLVGDRSTHSHLAMTTKYAVLEGIIFLDVILKKFFIKMMFYSSPEF